MAADQPVHPEPGEDGLRRRRIAWLVVGLIALLIVAAIGFFEPWDSGANTSSDGDPTVAEVDQAVRSAAGHDQEGSDPAPPDGTELSRGTFEGRSGQSVESGTALVLETPDGKVVRVDGLKVTSGPDLHVYLSTAPSDALTEEFGFDFVDLGSLRYNVGTSNYPVPDDVDIANYRSVVVWSKEFGVNFAVAPVKLQQ
jgi:Electron transfer DM13